MDLQELLDRAADVANLSDEELSQLISDLDAAASALADVDTDEALGQIIQIADAVDTLRAESTQREEAAATRASERDAALARIRGPEEDETEAEDEPEEVPEPEAEVPAEEAEPEPVPVAASAPPARRPARVGRVAARRPASTTPRPAQATDLSQWNLTASANISGIQEGQRITDAEMLAVVFGAAIKQSAGYRGGQGSRVKIPVARIGDDRDPTAVGYTADRVLDRDYRANLAKIGAAQRRLNSAENMAAAGGICAPPEVRYDLPIVGDDTRPFRDEALLRFGADRGGVTTLPPPLLDELDDAVGIWTEANDQNPSAPATKPCLTVTCPAEDTTVVDAITRCLQYGNFRARFFAEQIEAWMQLAAVRHARLAEVTMMTRVGTGSTDVDAAEGLGSSVDVLTTLDRAVAGMRSRHRITTAFPLRFVAPAWLRDNMRANQARESYGSADERFAIADADINRWIATRNVNVTWVWDGEPGQIFGPQGDGPLLGWPDTAVTYLYPEGSWLFLDGGTLDLGIVRDSTLNSTNDVQVFAETFENVHFHGVESQRIEMDICASGHVAAAVDYDPCVVGS